MDFFVWQGERKLHSQDLDAPIVNPCGRTAR